MAAEGTIRRRLRSLLRSNSIKLKRRGAGARHQEQLQHKVLHTHAHARASCTVWSFTESGQTQVTWSEDSVC